jgi:hypothetical protein
MPRDHVAVVHPSRLKIKQEEYEMAGACCPDKNQPSFITLFGDTLNNT